MDNTKFRALVEALKDNPDALHALFCEDCNHPSLDDLLGDRERFFATSISPERRLELAFLKDNNDALAHRDAIAACVDSCEVTRAVQSFGVGTGCHEPTCACTGGTCGGATAALTSSTAAQFENFQELHCGPTCGVTSQRLPGRDFANLSCDANVTCSCTTGTCGGVTCGGSTCSATCTGDSCGNTCGDSCGHTTNLGQPFNVDTRWQFQRFR